MQPLVTPRKELEVFIMEKFRISDELLQAEIKMAYIELMLTESINDKEENQKLHIALDYTEQIRKIMEYVQELLCGGKADGTNPII